MEDKQQRLLIYFLVPYDLASTQASDYLHIVKALRDAPQLIHQFVPIELVHSKLWTEENIGAFVTSTYDQCPLFVGRTIHRNEFESSGRSHVQLDAPAFKIAQPQIPQFRYSLDWEAKRMDSTDRHVLLHVGYSYSTCKRWVFGVCIDQRGERHRLECWEIDELEGDGCREDRLTHSIWKFAMDFIRHVNTEWVVIICKLGRLNFVELEGKSKCFTGPIMMLSMLQLGSIASNQILELKMRHSTSLF